MKIAYLGPTGSFSDLTTKKIFTQKSCDFVLYESLDKLQQALFKKEIDIIVMPFFNSKEGQLKSAISGKTYIQHLLDVMRLDPSFQVVGEKFTELNFCLLAKEETLLSDIKLVHVNPYGENLCKEFLAQHPDWQVQKHASSSAAALATRETPDITQAALASKTAAAEYGLKILNENILIGDEIPIMHFLVLSHLNACELEAYLPLATPNMSIYAVQAPDLQFIKTALQKEAAKLLNIYPIDTDTWYLELEGDLQYPETIHAKLLGHHTACKTRPQHQKAMLTKEFKQT